jgi:ribosomal protein S18 acetylase RimI-like enzyme
MKLAETLSARPRPAIAIVTPADRDAITVILVAAFQQDPVARWMFAEEQVYHSRFPVLIAALGGGAFAHDAAYYTTDYSGAALWLPPEIPSDEATIADLVERTLDGERRATAFALFEQMARTHPREPHWYLPFIGVEPYYQGQGIGGALLEASLVKCDEAGIPAYLESTSPRNVALYRRYGFKVTGEIRVGTCPPLIPMIRPPRS